MLTLESHEEEEDVLKLAPKRCKRLFNDDKDQMGGLNIDCLEQIFSYLDCVDLMKVSTTCKTWSNLTGYMLKKRKGYAVKDTLPFRLAGKCVTSAIRLFEKTDLSVLDLSRVET